MCVYVCVCECVCMQICVCLRLCLRSVTEEEEYHGDLHINMWFFIAKNIAVQYHIHITLTICSSM